MGAEGILFGQAIGSVLFGCLGFYMARNYITELEAKEASEIVLSNNLHGYDEIL
jgi:positive regulator of sigma E activity